MCQRWAIVLFVVLFTAALSLSVTPSPCLAAVKAPKWLLDQVSRTLPSYPPETEAVVLLHEQTTSVTPKGVLVTTSRLVTKVLRQGGVAQARVLVRAGTYDIRVRSMTGWVVNPAGEPRKTTMKQALSTSLAPDTLYMDARLIMLFVPEVGPGSVVGFEWEEERTPPSLEDIFEFQGRFPIIQARYSLSLPPGWTAESHVLNMDPLDPHPGPADLQTVRFEIANVPAVAREPYMPHELALAGRLLVRLIAPFPDPRCFTGWADMGTWYEGLIRERRVPNKDIAEKVAQLIAGAPDILAKILILADFVQTEIRYVSIQIGIGGFQPHFASSVLDRRYGDCKDKAILLSAMLAAIGVDSYPVIVHTERGRVAPDSPVSLYSFNHAVLAVRLPDEARGDGLDALVTHSRLGRLLVFDPTMPTAPLGRLPSYLQDNTALLVAEGSGELIRLPRSGPEGNLLERTGRFRLTGAGDLVGEIREIRRGAQADSLRYRIQSSSEAERRKILETFLSDSLPSFTLKDYEFENLDSPHGDLSVRYDLVVQSYARSAGGFVVLRPRVVGRKAVDLTSRESKARRHPIDLETTLLARDEFAFELPDGMAAESLPKPVALDAGFATYRSATESAGGLLIYRREYRLVEPLLPAARFDEALKFYLAVGAEEQQNALLKTPDQRRP